MFKNFVTLVTGASSGIGKATALHFAGKGARVVLCDSSEAAGAAVAKTIGDNALFVPTDISSEKSVQALLEQIEKKFGKLNVIVNCQSLSSPFACRTYDFEAKKSHSLEEFQKIFVTNASGVFNVVRLGVGLIGKNEPDIDNGKGVIINTIATTAHYPLLGQVANDAVNASIAALTGTWAIEFATQGIRMVAIGQGNFGNENASDEDKQQTYQSFAKLAHVAVTTPYVNGTTLSLNNSIH